MGASKLRARALRNIIGARRRRARRWVESWMALSFGEVSASFGTGLVGRVHIWNFGVSVLGRFAGTLMEFGSDAGIVVSRDWANGLRRFRCHFEEESLADDWGRRYVEIWGLVDCSAIEKGDDFHDGKPYKLAKIEHFWWKLLWWGWQIVVSSILVMGVDYFIVEIVLFWGDCMAGNVLFVEIEPCWWELRRIELRWWQTSRNSSRIDLRVGSWWRQEGKLYFHYEKHNLGLWFEAISGFCVLLLWKARKMEGKLCDGLRMDLALWNLTVWVEIGKNLK